MLDDTRDLATSFDLRIDWTLAGDPPSDQTIAHEIAELGIDLPGRPPLR